jgi:hypothetical protein
VIVGAGKTAMDTCLWLLGHGIAPQRLTWIKPRDAWLLNALASTGATIRQARAG